MKEKIVIKEHGTAWVPPIPKTPETITCPECGETACGFDLFDDDSFLDLWDVVGYQRTVKRVKFGVIIEDKYTTYTCPECGCTFERLEKRGCDVTNLCWRLLCIAAVAFLSCIVCCFSNANNPCPFAKHALIVSGVVLVVCVAAVILLTLLPKIDRDGE